ncbi:hypothetical protein sync_1103 [Synechococcus sp. CC9311]|nr:hypothetical protein sync_1103 [Synechococcus sp. CC9311]
MLISSFQVISLSLSTSTNNGTPHSDSTSAAYFPPELFNLKGKPSLVIISIVGSKRNQQLLK